MTEIINPENKLLADEEVSGSCRGCCYNDSHNTLTLRSCNHPSGDLSSEIGCASEMKIFKEPFQGQTFEMHTLDEFAALPNMFFIRDSDGNLKEVQVNENMDIMNNYNKLPKTGRRKRLLDV